MTLPARACEVVGRTYLGNVLVSATRMMQVHATFVSAKNGSAQTARAFDFEVSPICDYRVPEWDRGRSPTTCSSQGREGIQRVIG